MATTDLVESYKNFKDNQRKENIELFEDLVENGQHPKTLFITCSDSRVAPNFITDTKPGDLFIARNIGNFVPTFAQALEASATPAAIEYAVSALNVENIIICGHSNCGACKALHQEIDENDVSLKSVRQWLKIGDDVKTQAIEFVKTRDKKSLYEATEKLNIIQQLKNLQTYPEIAKRVASKDIYLQGWYHHLEDGTIEYFNPENGEFLPLEDMSSDVKSYTDEMPNLDKMVS
jgi:carbonic anhydrase